MQLYLNKDVKNICNYESPGTILMLVDWIHVAWYNSYTRMLCNNYKQCFRIKFIDHR